ncbi:FolE GTP cyclohydrolase I [uncultured Caudovirales phage]|uniref:GTP cyclohydrolase I n=1 Tax=uncultured Caudovirales phage TaxID=2100421 RepID=A0A6J7X5C4_9CAUD|nr:FolE GTP cyclohydrolase I [uncultured Caudovirales phage]
MVAINKMAKINEDNLDVIRDLISIIGDNPFREGLIDTPKRVLKSYDEIFAGYSQNAREILSTTFEEDISYNQIILSRDIPFSSFCEHHMLPFTGKAHVAYLPNKKVVGLSKLARVVDMFAKRLQIQEKMTDQIADAIFDVLQPKGVGVMITAHHTCMSMRGVNKQDSQMLTTALRGTFLTEEHKQEFYNMINTR